MSEKMNDKILKFSNRPIHKYGNKAEIKNFQGFDYVKMEKDLNGTPFIRESLQEYANECKYMIRVMREENNKVFLCNYYVPQERLCEFLTKIENKEFDGQVIEVEKYIPEDLA